MIQSFIGLEIHIQLDTESKVFCSCRAAFGEEPNTNVCPVCMGQPGVLPTLNREAVRMAYLVARALECRLAEVTLFERKNYFYPDMPKNYQISQFSLPLGTDGRMDIEFHRRPKRVRIKEVHLEEDAGKMIHAGEMSLLDYNRAGTALLEIVTQPDLEVGEEAERFLQDFRRMVRYLGVCDGNMEQGSLRCDANVSVNFEGQGLGAKVEIKNLNSFKFVRKALNFEIERQREILERGGTVLQETRLWNENRDVTEGMRTKESALDYRYFPEPDLPPFRPDEAFLAAVEGSLVELPAGRRQRLLRQYGITEHQAEFLCEEREIADYFERAVTLGADARAVALWLASDVQKLLNRSGLRLAEAPLTSERLAELLALLDSRRIHGRIAKQVLEVVFAEDKGPAEIVAERGWEQITSAEKLRPVVAKVVQDNPAAAAQLKGGEARPLGFLIGEVMKRTGGRAEPGTVRELLKEALELSFVQILSMGGAIGARRSESGEIVPGGVGEVLRALEADPEVPRSLRFEEIEISRILSEEIVPEDWAALIVSLQRHLGNENSSGIVIAHGTDTLAYTASLLFWLFPRPELPVVLAASLDPGEAAASLKGAILAACSSEAGIYVYVDGRLLSPLNLKFERVRRDGFSNWNLPRPVFSYGTESEAPAALPGRQGLTRALERALDRACIVKTYPGLKAELLIALMEAGVRYFVLELYDTGTANLRESPYSLKRAFLEGRERGVRFFCTSQQEGVVDFSGYVTSHELWKEGAIPMGSLTTEATFTRLLAALMLSGEEERLLEAMEEANADLDLRAW